MDDKLIEKCKKCEKQCMQKGPDRSRSCRAAIKQKPTLMDRESVKNLSARQKVSQWIEQLSRSYWEKLQITQWIEIALTSVNKRRKRVSIDSNLSRICREAIELDKNKKINKIKNKNNFSKRKKTHRNECNQANYSTKDPNNMLSFQKHLSTRKIAKHSWSKTHTCTKQV